MYQIKVREVMTADVITFSPKTTFREIQLCLKKHRFSGTPIVDDDQTLMGMVSIDDIITAFDAGHIDDPVGPYMTTDLVTVPQNHSAIAASNLFNKHRYGRLPVVEGSSSNKLVGIVTFGDILSHLLVIINSIAERVEEEERLMARDMEQQRGSLHFELAPDKFDVAGVASTMIKKRLKACGIPSALVRRVAVICYEAEMNVILHSLGGYIVADIYDDRVLVRVTDEGPGIPDLERAMEKGYTTANEKIRALGFGAGMGLANIKECSDEFSIRSSMDTGTELESVVYLPKSDENAETQEGATA